MTNQTIDRATLIGEETRERSFKCVLLGKTAEARDILDDGVRRLENEENSVPQRIRIYADLGMLGDKEKREKGRRLLRAYAPTRDISSPWEDEQQESPTAKFQHDLDHAEEKLELACCLEDWDMAKAAYLSNT